MSEATTKNFAERICSLSYHLLLDGPISCLSVLRGSVPKNGPIDFASKNHFSLNSADGKGLVPKY